jgi:hypothetical protein
MPEPIQLSNTQLRFWEMVGKYPRMSSLWDLEKWEYNKDRSREARSFLSESECLMLDFFVSVWNGIDAPGFSLTGAARHLVEKDRLVIVDWLDDPFFP